MEPKLYRPALLFDQGGQNRWRPNCTDQPYCLTKEDRIDGDQIVPSNLVVRPRRIDQMETKAYCPALLLYQGGWNRWSPNCSVQPCFQTKEYRKDGDQIVLSSLIVIPRRIEQMEPKLYRPALFLDQGGQNIWRPNCTVQPCGQHHILLTLCCRHTISRPLFLNKYSLLKNEFIRAIS